LLSRLFNKQAEPDDSGSASVFKAMMEEAAASLEASFVRQYGWDADGRTRKVESLVMAKFIMDQALVSTFCDRLSRKRLKNLCSILDTIFETLLHRLSPETAPDPFMMKFRDYSVMLRGNKAPLCWQLIAGSVVGRDLVEDPPTKEMFPQFLLDEFVKVRERLKEVII